MLTGRKFKAALGVGGYLFSRALCLGALILICSTARAQNLFGVHVDVDSNGHPINATIDEFTPNGVRSTFASGLADGFNIPFSLAFDETGNLFVAVGGGGERCHL